MDKPHNDNWSIPLPQMTPVTRRNIIKGLIISTAYAAILIAVILWLT